MRQRVRQGISLPSLVCSIPQVEEGHDYCVITPPAALKPHVAIDTYDDHRMAMAFSLAACGGVPVIINDPGCTRKTFPTYFKVFEGVVEH
jgi:3-phosphoshikimate 1-carboxyvinyltransferase